MTRMSFYPRLWKRVWKTRSRTRSAALAGIALVGVIALLGELYGYLRALLAFAMFVVILAIGIRLLRTIFNAPPEPDLAEVADYELRYVCPVCGLELKLEVAAADKAPRHCMEEMVLVQRGGRPPLRPVN